MDLACTAISTRSRTFLPRRRFEIALGASGRATLVARAVGNIRCAARREPQLPQHLHELGRLLVMIVPKSDDRSTPVCLRRFGNEIEVPYGKTAWKACKRLAQVRR